MIRSMTGYGHYKYQGKQVNMDVEIKTVNHRYCDVYIRIPRQLNSFEEKIRSLITSRISRGKVDVFLSWENLGEGVKKVILDSNLAREYYSAISKLASDLKLRDDISALSLARFPELLKIENQDDISDDIWHILEQSFNGALDELILMREAEGRKLRESLYEICKSIESHRLKIKEREPLVVVEYKERLTNRIKDLMEDSSIDEMRLAMEIAIFADKCGINEELVRLGSHIAQFNDILSMEGPRGKKLDFLIQEMNREVNTIGAKANDIEITKIVVELKSDIEKMREQIQNIE
ncbi:MAG TPA: YicC/YloC family endoribonuclease [Thermoclostridium sp.]|nr:YicC/YloC family endoribonuclease [Thermoclostridium sp.]